MDLKNKKILITGGTGSFGSTALSRFVSKNLFKEIRIFSRDEKKQFDLRKQFPSDKINFRIGDVRDYESVIKSVKGVDYIFHAAALKQVPSCEFYPLEAVKTNILGTNNVINAAREANIKKVICLSTDKAVYPINAMGFSKAMMEKICTSQVHSSEKNKTVSCVTRYGNVIASRGSLIPQIIDQIKNKKPITITDPKMTRFMMTLDDAIDLVIYALDQGKNGEIFVPKTKSINILDLAKYTRKHFKLPNYPIRIIGVRHGEKQHETLLTKEEKSRTLNMNNYFKIKPDNRNLNYENYLTKGIKQKKDSLEYNSFNSSKITEKEYVKMIKSIKAFY